MAEMPERPMRRSQKSNPKAPEENPWVKRLWRMKQYQLLHSHTWIRNEKLLFGDLPNLKVASAFKSLAGHPKNAYGWGLFKLLESEIYVQNPSCRVRGFLQMLDEAGWLLEQAIKYDLEQENVRGMGSMLLLDNFICGYGVAIETVETRKEWLRYPDPETGQNDELALVKDQHFVWRRIHPKDFLVDPKSLRIDLSDARYCATRFYPTVQELRDDTSFKLPEKIDQFPECYVGSDMEEHRDNTKSMGQSASQSETDPEYRTIAVWEVHDNVNQQLVYVTDFQHHILKEEDVSYDLQFGSRRLYPLTVLGMHTQPRTWYPRAEVDLVAAQLEEMNLIDALMTRDSLTKWRKTLILGDIVKKEEVKKIASPELLNSFIIVDPVKAAEVTGIQDGTQIDLRRMTLQLEDPAMNRDLPIRKQMLEQDIQHTLGYGPADRGGMPSTRTAREAVFIHSRQEQKLATRLEAVNLFYKDLIAKHVRLLQQLGVTQRYARVVDSTQGLEMFRAYRGNQLKGDFDFEILPGSSGPRTSEQKRAEELNLFQIVTPILAQQGKSIDAPLRRLLRWWGDDRGNDLLNDELQRAQDLAVALAYFRVGKSDAATVLEAATKLTTAMLPPPALLAIQQKIQQQILGPQQLMDQVGAVSGVTGGGAAAGGPSAAAGDPNAMMTAAGNNITGRENA